MTDTPTYTPAPAADFVLAFDLPKVGLRGRLVRLEAASARALSAHALPEPAERILGETLAMSVLLGSALKLDGRLTVQTKSQGALDLVTADYYGAQTQDDGATTPIGIRGYARLNKDRFEQLGKKASFNGIVMGHGGPKGVMAITIEPRRDGKAYQGIVDLSPEGIATSAETYFAQSEQLPTAIRLAAAPLFVAGSKEPQWRVGGIMLQATPEAAKAAELSGGVNDDYDRLVSHLRTVEDLELVDTSVSGEQVLWRLFNEDEVRVHTSEPVEFRCECNADRIIGVLKGYPAEDRKSLQDDDGIIRAKCEFCAKTHEIGEAQLA